jgi:hypothetical protein
MIEEHLSQRLLAVISYWSPAIVYSPNRAKMSQVIDR